MKDCKCDKDTEEDVTKSDIDTIMQLIMFDSEKGWAKISSGLMQEFDTNKSSFNIRFDDGTQNRISLLVTEI